MQQIPLDLPPVSDYQLDQWQYTRWARGDRYYEAQLQQDLWGDWMLTRSWGCKTDKQGRQLNHHYSSYHAGRSVFKKTAKRRQRSGYITVSESI